MKEKILKLNI